MVTAAYLAFGGLVVAMVLVGSIMATRIAPRIREAAGCRKLFDERINGYDFQEAKAFLNALTPEGANAYLKMTMQWDMVFPLLYGAVLCILIQWATPETFPIPPFIMALIGLVVAICAFRENAFVAVMLMGGPDHLTPELAARASFWTRWKWRLLFVAVGMVAVLAGIRFLWTGSGGAAS